jgi:hypothetical protein
MDGFEDLLHFHGESLAADETELLTSMIALADELRGDLSPTQSIIPHSYLTPGGEVSGAACARDMRVSNDTRACKSWGGSQGGPRVLPATVSCGVGFYGALKESHAVDHRSKVGRRRQ